MFGTALENHTWTVTQLTGYIRELFEIDYRLQDVLVAGEISNFTQARSGHLYFTLKDDKAQLKCVMWRSSAERLRFQPRDGDAVIAYGRISVYEAGGAYQLYAESLDPAGRGGLAVAFEQLKEKLTEEGLFDAEFKKPIPKFPQKLGIVTSADAAALRDILNVLRRRWPLVLVLIAPTLVQGKEAPTQIVRAIEWLDGRNDIDTILVARGGGSIEDLWAFNDEGVARAIFAARHPIITGVGHETDFTISDFVADLRAPTPSAAAELAVPDIDEVSGYLQGLRNTLTAEMLAVLAEGRREVEMLTRSMSHLSPGKSLDNNRQRVDMLSERLERTMKGRVSYLNTRIEIIQARLQAVSPYGTLARGYAIVRHEDGRVVHQTGEVVSGETLRVMVTDGEFDVTVNSSST
ncbi:MAG: exodeoxyribonuclease VII large subunit [Candidatus Promineifilaceae bacterium]